MSIHRPAGNELASELLNSNMENISNELSALLIGGELEGAVTSAPIGLVEQSTNHGRGIVGGNASATAVAAAAKQQEMAQLYRQYCYYQQQLQQQQQQQQQQQIVETPVVPPTAGGANNYVNVAPSPVAAATNAPALAAGSPKFEFHYLRCQTLGKAPSSNADPMPLLSSAAAANCLSNDQHVGGATRRGITGNAAGATSGAGNGGYRRHSKHAETQSSEPVDYDKVVVDLSVLGLSEHVVERNPVLRLFGHLRKMHFYLNDKFPSPWNASDIVEGVEMPASSSKPSMPCTMNVQYQVKQAARKCNIFLCEMQRIIGNNKIYNRELYLECEQSLNVLRRLLTQFEMFKRIELEHKRGQFVTEEARVQAECLEALVQQLNDQIRESHFYVHIFNWAVQHKCQQQQQQQQQQQNSMPAPVLPPQAPSQPPPQFVEFATQQMKPNIAELAAGLAAMKYGDVAAHSKTADIELDMDRQSTRYIGYK